MSHTIYKPPPDNLYTYIEQNRRSAAIPNKGIAALFHSTGFYVIAVTSAYINGIRHKHAYIFRQERVFLFTLKMDKPCYNPGCRSPPIPPFSKIREKGGQA